MKSCVCFVTFYNYNNFDWTKLCVLSFKKIFKNKIDLIVVDHNKNEEEINFLNKNKITIIENKSNYLSHGHGLDVAVNYAKENLYDSIVFIEPDCFISGRLWYNNLIKSLNTGYSMSATTKHPAGWLNICGSAWILKDIPGSFTIQPKKEKEVFSKKHDELKLNIFSKEYYESLNFFYYYWDCGIRNWFLLEKTQLVDGSGLNHFYFSSEIKLNDYIKKNNNNCIKKFIFNNMRKTYI